MTDATSGPDNASEDDSSGQELILEVACNVANTLEQAVGLGEEDLLRVALLTLERVRVSESVEISVLVTDDEGLHELNRDFRGKDETTDVLSFPLLAAPLVEAPADELWQPDEDDNGDDAAQVEQWPDSADHGSAGLMDSDDDEESDTTTTAAGDGDGDAATTTTMTMGQCILGTLRYHEMLWCARRRRLATAFPGSAPICLRMGCYI